MNYTANYLAGIVIVVVMAKILMIAANYIGEQIGIGKFLIDLWQKLAKSTIPRNEWENVTQIFVTHRDLENWVQSAKFCRTVNQYMWKSTVFNI